MKTPRSHLKKATLIVLALSALSPVLSFGQTPLCNSVGAAIQNGAKSRLEQNSNRVLKDAQATATRKLCMSAVIKAAAMMVPQGSAVTNILTNAGESACTSAANGLDPELIYQQMLARGSSLSASAASSKVNSAANAAGRSSSTNGVVQNAVSSTATSLYEDVAGVVNGK